MLLFHPELSILVKHSYLQFAPKTGRTQTLIFMARIFPGLIEGKRIWMTENGFARHFKRWLSWPSPLFLSLASWNWYHVLLILLHHLQFFSTKLRSVIHFSETPLNNGYLPSSPFSPAKESLAAPSWSPAPDRFKHLNWKELYTTEMDRGSISPLPPKTR